MSKDSSSNDGNPPHIPKGKKWICRPWITVKGQRIYASQKGLKAFCFMVDA